MCVNFGVTKSCDDGRDGGELLREKRRSSDDENTMTLPQARLAFPRANASHAGTLQGFRYACLCFCLALSNMAGSFLQGTHCKRHTEALHVPHTTRSRWARGLLGGQPTTYTKVRSSARLKSIKQKDITCECALAVFSSCIFLLINISFYFIVNFNLPPPSSSFSSSLPFLLHLPTTLIATGAAQTLEAAGQQVLFPALAPRSFGFEQPDFVIASSGVRQKLLLVPPLEQLDEHRLFVVVVSPS